MKKNIFIFAVLFALVFSAFGVNTAVQAQSGDTTGVRTIEVNGEAIKYKAPDMATITLGVQTNDKTAADAEAENSAIMNVIFGKLEDLGIERSDIQTSNFYVYQNYNFDNDGNRTNVYYNVTNTVSVVVRDLDKLGDVISTVLENGANDVQGITYDLSNKEEIYADVLEQAIKNGMSRAEVMANTVNADLGEVLSISTALYGGGYTLSGDVMAKNAYGLGGGGGTPVSSGEIEISVTVLMKVEMK
jgi:uncharacterized protein YggE